MPLYHYTTLRTLHNTRELRALHQLLTYTTLENGLWRYRAPTHAAANSAITLAPPEGPTKKLHTSGYK